MISPAVDCSRIGETGELEAWAVCSMPSPLGNSCPSSSSSVSTHPNPEHLGKPQSERTARVQQHQLHPRRREAPGEEGEHQLSQQRSLENRGCHSSQELIPVTLMWPFSVPYSPVVTMLCRMLGGGAPPRGCFWNWFLLWAHLSPWQLGEGLGWPCWPLGAIFGVLSPREVDETQPETDGRWEVSACWRHLAPYALFFLKHTAQDSVSLLGPHSRSFPQRGSLRGRRGSFETNAFAG